MSERIKQPLHVVIASDGNYMHLVSVCITSLFDTNDEPIHVHLLSNRIGEDALGELEEIVRIHGGALSIYPIENLRERLTIDVPDTISVTSYARLFVCSLLPENIDRLLYIDCDIMFNDSIAELFDTDMDGCLVAGVLDPLISRTYKREINIACDEPYINAGVLLIPLTVWRKENMERRFIDYLVAHNGKVHHHDQGIINAICAGRKRIVSPRYNAMSNCFCFPWKSIRSINIPFYDKAEYESASRNPAIIHFTGAILNRPWVEGCSHPYADKFLRYKSETAYKDRPLLPNDQSFMHRMEGFMYRNFPFCICKAYLQTVCRLSRVKHLLLEYI